ncbi:unnamed protein product, partial [Effrenium voratum]
PFHAGNVVGSLLKAAMGLALASHFAECPFGTRLLAALYGLGCGVPAILASAGVPTGRTTTNLFLCCTANILGRQKLAPLLLSALHRPLQRGGDLFMAVTELQMALSFLPQVERELGTLRYLLWLLANTTGINGLFVLAVKLLGRSGLCSELRSNQGLWSLAVACMTRRALENPELPCTVMGLVEVPQKWYPVAIALMLSVLEGSIQWETFCAALFAYLWRLLHLDRRLLPSPSQAAALEDRAPKVPGLLSLLGGHWVRSTRHPPNRGQGVRTENAEAPRGFQIFGGRGHRLGD